MGTWGVGRGQSCRHEWERNSGHQDRTEWGSSDCVCLWWGGWAGCKGSALNTTHRDRVPWLLAKLEQRHLPFPPQHWSRLHQLRMLGTRSSSGNFLPAEMRPLCVHNFATKTLVQLEFPLPIAILCRPGEQAGQKNSPGGQVGRKDPSETQVSRCPFSPDQLGRQRRGCVWRSCRNSNQTNS